MPEAPVVADDDQDPGGDEPSEQEGPGVFALGKDSAYQSIGPGQRGPNGGSGGAAP